MALDLVAGHLVQEAIRRIPADEADGFARTAFNRYYYSAYLEVRKGLRTLKPEWSQDLPHAQIPEILRGTIHKTFNDARNKALRRGDAEIIKMCESARSAASDLAKLLDLGRQVRVTADYHPEIPIDFVPQPNFVLNAISIDSARSWPHKAKAYVSPIVSTWRHLNV